MKTKNIFLYLPLLLTLMLGTMGCSSSDDEEIQDEVSQNIIGNVKLLNGTIRYDNISGRWFISYHKEGSIDSVINYYPNKLDDDFMIDGLGIIFSGLVYKGDLDTPQIGGLQTYCIDLSYIEKIK